MILTPRGESPHAKALLPCLVHQWAQSPPNPPTILRLLIPLDAHREFINQHGFADDTLAHLLGLGAWVDPVDRNFDPKAVRIELRKLHQTTERGHGKATVPACLGKNIDRLARLVGLTETDCRILEFAVLIHNERLLDDAADMLGQLSSSKVFRALAILLGRPEPEIQAALGSDGILSRSGLVSVERNEASLLRSKLDLLSAKFADHIASSDADPMSLLRETVVLATPGELELADYGDIGPVLEVLRPYLMNAVTTGRRGSNVFIYGAPGTGKNQLAKALAKEVASDLLEVASEDSDGDPVNGERRLRAFRAAQSFFGQRSAILLFDECEDAFNDGAGLFGRKSTAQTRKAWVNRMLEDNAVPTVWLCNSVDSLDTAFIRPFDLVVELPVPPKKQRVRIIQAACSGLVDTAGVDRIADSDVLAPALVTRAASVARSLRGALGEDGAGRAVELLISNTLLAQGHKPIRRNDPKCLPEVYDPAFIHADADLVAVASGLVKARSGRLCLYGPPGTGKTAFGRWLAEQLGVPLLVRRASDLMSKWVGDNERNIAQTFRQAEQDGCLLLIDEVDSFLQDRREARQGWEVSLVNEMLTQMESFSGVFIASTNLMGGIDQAALRRFDLKVRFGFLKSEQSQGLLRRHCTVLGINDPQGQDMARLVRLASITPGDFAAVIRQGRFRPIDSCSAFIAELEAECAVKECTTPAIGFLA